MGIKRVIIGFRDVVGDGIDQIVANISVTMEDSTFATVDDTSDTNFTAFWGKHLEPIIVKLQEECEKKAATSGK